MSQASLSELFIAFIFKKSLTTEQKVAATPVSSEADAPERMSTGTVQVYIDFRPFQYARGNASALEY